MSISEIEPLNLSMQSLPVSDNGVEIGYYDSGPPSGDSPYTTMVVIHGHTFNAMNFSRTLSRAKFCGIRAVSLARRDYAGSTPFSKDELSQLQGSDSTMHLQFLRDRGYEVAKFLSGLIEKHSLPSVDSGGAGGLFVVGWSLGVLTMNAFVHFFPTYPISLQINLRKHLRSFVAYDPPHYVLGEDDPEGLCQPLLDERIPEDERGPAFCEWVSAYFSHPYFQSEILSLEKKPTNFSEREPTDAGKFRPTTFETYTTIDREQNLDPEGGQRSDSLLLTMSRTALHATAVGALLLVHPTYGVNALPGVRFHFIFAQSSPWPCHWFNCLLNEYVAKWEREGRGSRIDRIVSVPAANHFLHWDDPDRFLQLCSSLTKISVRNPIHGKL